MGTSTSKGLQGAAVSIWNWVQVAVFVALLTPMMPVLLPLAGWSIARSERKLARTPCVACGQPIGADEINRAKAEALRAAWAGHDPLSGIRRRIVAVWHVVCPTCGQRYTYKSSQSQDVLVPEPN